MRAHDSRNVESLDPLSHYDVLEVNPGARLEEIERAYVLASATWAEGSLALYSLFDDSDAASMRERVRHAYSVLSNDRARRAYDQATFDSVPEPEPVQIGRLANVEPLDEDYDELEISLDEALDTSTLGDAEASDVEYDGARLRRARMNRGVELDDIAGITKVSHSYLQAIEDEDFEHLPAQVYVRGFVSAYARAIGLDPERVADSYLPRLEKARKERGRGRHFRR